MKPFAGKAKTIVFGLILAVGLVIGISACGSSSSSSSASSGSESGSSETAKSESSGGSGETYTIYLDINGTFNSWRTQMQHIVEFAAENPPYGEHVDFHFVDSSQQLSGQSTDLNNIIASKPDALLLDAASSTGLNPQVQKACAAGITVVSFDNVVTAPCAYKITLPEKEDGELLGTYIGEVIGGEGEVVVDKGIPGASVPTEAWEGYKAGLEKYPGISIAAEMESQFTPGLVKSQLGPILAAHPEVKAVLTAAFMNSALQAFEAAKIPPVPLTAETTTNGDAAGCVKAKIACAASSTPPYLGAEALKLAVELLEGKADESEKSVLINPPLLFTEPAKVEGFEEANIEKVEPISGLSPEAVFPIAPEWLKITPEQAVEGA
jgi:ribose transport system substrate-binding protein